MARRGGWRPTRTEQARLMDACIRLRRQGYTYRTIAEALGVAPTTVSDYLHRAGVILPKATHEPDIKPAPCPWRDGAPPRPDPPEAYQVSTTLTLLTAILRELRTDNAENRFAHDARDAELAGDRDWQASAAATINDMAAYVDRLRVVLWDRAARDAGITDPTHRDDLTPLRLLHGKG